MHRFVKGYVRTGGNVYPHKSAKDHGGRFDTIAAGKSRSVKVRVEYKKDITAAQLPSADTALSLTCSIPYVQA